MRNLIRIRRSKPGRLYSLGFWLFAIQFPGAVVFSYAQSPISGVPFVRNFQATEYKAGIQNWDIAQDRRGLIFIANNYGLLEYDGERWEIHGVRNGTKTRSVAIDSRGRIYVGSQGDFGYFFPDASGRLQYTSLADGLEARYRDINETWSVYTDNESVYFCTFSHIYLYHGGAITVVETKGIINICFLINRQLYVTDRLHGLSILHEKEFIPVPGGDFFSQSNISSILSLQNGQLLISTSQDGVFVLSNGKAKPWNESLQAFFKKAYVNCVVRLRNGNFAIGTQNEGLLVFSPEGRMILQLTRGRGLDNRTILSIYEDDLNNLWLGHNNGLAYVELGSPFTLINEQSGLPGTGYSAYLDDNRFYLATNTGVFLKEGAGDFKLIPHSSGQAYHLGMFGNDLLVGHHNGAMRIDEKNATIVSTEQDGAWVYKILKDHPDKLIGGTYSGLQLYKLVNGHWKFSKKLAGFHESSRIMAQDKANVIWVTHGYKGAYKITLNAANDSIVKVGFYGSNKGFPTNLLINVFNINGELLFASESGVYKYDEASDSFRPDTLFTGKLGRDVQIWYMEEDALGNIYFIGRDHIGVFRKSSIGDYVLEANAFNKIGKFLNDDLENITILKNNEVLFGAKDGFIHYDPNMNVERKSSFKTLIRKVSTTNEGDSVLFYGNYTQGDSITSDQPQPYKLEIAYRNNSISVAFSATLYEGKDELQYQYYLENYEKNWSEWGNKTQKEYTNLIEGPYTFHVHARNIKGEISPEATYEFYIHPPWYRSIGAYSFYAVFVIGCLFVAFNLVHQKYQREQKIMQAHQEKELTIKEDEIVKIAQQSQEEITRLQNEKLESELDHMNNELATSTMHLLNKNEFITGIKASLVHIIKKSNSAEVKKELEHINHEIENNISADADWEQFQFHFDRVHGDFSNRFKAEYPSLSPQEVKLSAYLRMNLSTKEIAQLLNISVRGVEISRYRLRKKLTLDRSKNLQDFILNF